MQYLNNKYALTLCESVKKVVFDFWQSIAPPSVLDWESVIKYNLKYIDYSINMAEHGFYKGWLVISKIKSSARPGCAH